LPAASAKLRQQFRSKWVRAKFRIRVYFYSKRIPGLQFAKILKFELVLHALIKKEACVEQFYHEPNEARLWRVHQ